MSPPERVERDYPLARLTTIRTGGPADWFTRPDSPERLAELLAWAGREEIAVGVVGSGSNLLVADAGFRGLVLKLDGSLSTIEQDGHRLLCGPVRHGRDALHRDHAKRRLEECVTAPCAARLTGASAGHHALRCYSASGRN